MDVPLLPLLAAAVKNILDPAVVMVMWSRYMVVDIQPFDLSKCRPRGHSPRDRDRDRVPFIVDSRIVDVYVRSRDLRKRYIYGYI